MPQLQLEEDAKRELESIYMDRVIEQTEFGSCWVFIGASATVDGYGLIGTRRLGKLKQRVHRFMYELRFGPVDPDLCVMHSCANKRCWKYGHLSVGTWAENNQEANDRGVKRGGKWRVY